MYVFLKSQNLFFGKVFNFREKFDESSLSEVWPEPSASDLVLPLSSPAAEPPVATDPAACLDFGVL